MISQQEREERKKRIQAYHEKYNKPYEEKTEETEFQRSTHTCQGRCYQIFKIMLPIGSAQICEVFIDLANIYFSAHFQNNKYLAANGLAISMMNIIAFATLYGISTAQETLASQAFGAKNYKKAGHYLNLTRLIVLVATFLIVFPIFFFGGSILALIGIQEELAQITGTYLRIVFGGIIFQGQSGVIRRFLRTQRIVWVHILVVGVSLPFHWIGMYLVVRVFDLGYYSIPAWTCATYVLSFSTFHFCFYCCKLGHADTRVRPHCRDFEGTCEYLKIAIPAMLLLCLGWWSFEITTVAMGYLGEVYLGAHTVLCNLAAMIFVMTAMSFSSTMTSLVGNSMGMNNVKLAKQFARQITIYCYLVFIVIISFVYFQRYQIIPLLSSSKSVNDQILKIMPLLCGAMLCMIGNQLTDGVLRGIGRLRIPLIFMLLTYYFFYQPLSLYFAFNGYYLTSVWGFMMISELILTLFNLLLMFKYNWSEIALEVQEKMRHKDLEEPLLEDGRVQQV